MSNQRHDKFVVGAFYENTVIPPIGALCVYVTLSGAAHFVVRTGDDDSAGSDGPGPIYGLVDWFSDAKSRHEWKEVWPEPENTIRVWPNSDINEPVKRWDASGNLVWEHPKSKGWFLPTRFHETPGRYEDEDGRTWWFREGEWWETPVGDLKPKWQQTCWTPYRNTYINGSQLHPVSIHVRWVGDLDD